MATTTPIRTQITVGKCAECPFFERTVVNFFVEMLAKASGAYGGACRYGALGQKFPIGRLPISDSATVPVFCPLRTGDCLIQLGAKPS